MNGWSNWFHFDTSMEAKVFIYRLIYSHVDDLIQNIHGSVLSRCTIRTHVIGYRIIKCFMFVTIHRCIISRHIYTHQLIWLLLHCECVNGISKYSILILSSWHCCHVHIGSSIKSVREEYDRMEPHIIPHNLPELVTGIIHCSTYRAKRMLVRISSSQLSRYTS